MSKLLLGLSVGFICPAHPVPRHPSLSWRGLKEPDLLFLFSPSPYSIPTLTPVASSLPRPLTLKEGGHEGERGHVLTTPAAPVSTGITVPKAHLSSLHHEACRARRGCISCEEVDSERTYIAGRVRTRTPALVFFAPCLSNLE